MPCISQALSCATSYLRFTINLRGRCYYPHHKGIKLRMIQRFVQKKEHFKSPGLFLLCPPPPHQLAPLYVCEVWVDKFVSRLAVSEQSGCVVSSHRRSPLSLTAGRVRDRLGTWRLTTLGLTSVALGLTPGALSAQLPFSLAFPHWGHADVTELTRTLRKVVCMKYRAYSRCPGLVSFPFS